MKYLTLSIPGFPNIDTGATPLPQGVPIGGLFDKGINILGVFINLILVIAILFSVFTIAHGAINIITSTGDKQKVQAGRNRIYYALIGLILIFISFFFINVVSSFVGIPLLSILK